MKKLKIGFLTLSAAIFAVGLSACGAPAETHTHKLTEITGTASTCSEQGYTTHFACDGCDGLFLDKDGKIKITEDKLSLPLLQHTYKDVKKDTTQHWLKCEVCSETTERVNHVFTTVPNKAATQTSDGYTAGDVCLDCGYGKNGGKVLPKATLFKSETYDGLNYCSYQPEGIINEREKLPLIVFLHGSGERGDDNTAQLKNAITKVVCKGSESLFMKAAVLVPQCPENMMWADTPWENGNYKLSEIAESETNKKVVNLVRHYISKEYIDADRVYVMGISMGGFGTWDLLARHSDIFAAGIPVCGGGPDDKIETLKNIPIYTFHSENDISVPYSGTKAMVDAIKAAGGEKIEFVSFGDKGHVIWDIAITYPGLEQWLFAQKND